MSKQARIRTQEMRKAQQEEARRRQAWRRALTWVGGLVILALVAAIVVVAVRAASTEKSPTASGKVVPPHHLTSAGAIPVGSPRAPVTVEIYYDYMCPACGAFEAANGDELGRLVEAGRAKLALRPISFLDKQSNGTEYSTRAANAIATVADQAPKQVWPFHAALYAKQPQEGSSGLTDGEIARIATDAGVPQAVVDRFEKRTYEPWVRSRTKAAFDGGINGTPTVKINGEVFQGDLYTKGPLTAAIDAAGR